jgi:hypothetical protein
MADNSGPRNTRCVEVVPGKKRLIKWLAGSQASRELAALRAVQDLPGAVKLEGSPIPGPDNHVGLVMRWYPRYSLDRLSGADARAFMQKFLQVLPRAVLFSLSFDLSLLTSCSPSVRSPASVSVLTIASVACCFGGTRHLSPRHQAGAPATGRAPAVVDRLGRGLLAGLLYISPLPRHPR